MKMVHMAWDCMPLGWRKVQVSLDWVSKQQVLGLCQKGQEDRQAKQAWVP